MFVVILVIIGLVITISLVDFFSSINWQQVTSTNRNEIVFEHRNKRYGAYVLRRDYSKNMLVIMLSVFMVIAAVFAGFKIAKSFKKKAVVQMEMPQRIETFTVKNPPKQEEHKTDIPPPPPEKEPPAMEKMVAFVPPRVVDEPVEADLPNPNDDGKLGPRNQEGDENGPGRPKSDPSGGPEKSPDPEPDPKPKEDDIMDYVEEEASFPGGFPALMAYINKNLSLPDVVMDQGVNGKVLVQFVVEKNGSISNISVARPIAGCPECSTAAINVFKKMPNWSPGKNGGRPVRQKLQLPIKISTQ